jgi:hypothetical protein
MPCHSLSDEGGRHGLSRHAQGSGTQAVQIEDLLPLVDAILQALVSIRPGQTVAIAVPA